jgi:GNAT superfamily N-acetyltransferase
MATGGITRQQAALVQMLEELSFNAQPAAHTLFYDGWLLRFANGYTRRANSVNPLYGSSVPLDEKIAYCQSYYDAHEQPLMFKLTSRVHPTDLDERLGDMGFRQTDVVNIRALNLEHVEKTPTLTDIWVDRSFKGQWLLEYGRMSELDQEQIPNAAFMLASILPPACFLTLRVGDAAVALGLAVLDRGWLGIFDVVVDPQWRGQGMGRELMLHLLAWGKQNGARYSYLQVVQTNSIANALYDSLGYQDVYRYWYRQR